MKILHVDKNHPLLIQGLESAGHENIELYFESKSEILKIIHEFDVIIIRSRFPLDKKFLAAAKKLKIIGRLGAGIENIDFDFAKQKGIKVLSAPEGNRSAVGEHVIGMILCLMNKLIFSHQKIQNGIWDREISRGYEIENKVIGIIGYGNMGRSLAKKLRGFNAKVIFHDIKKNIGDQYAEQVTVLKLKNETQILSLHIPQTKLTKGMIDLKFISEMKNPFWLINTSRGSNVVTKDLIKGLQNGKILGAGLDVLEHESSSFNSIFSEKQIPESIKYLINTENVILSPHVAGWTYESYEKLSKIILDKILSEFLLNQSAIN
ncbi:MAG: NAD(P)-dependent oxidoreductase [Flavobacteriaceae bacterium]|nr:NAD(P)-dependent oxidoreductase [Flavobacteriaceae bacterium]